MGVELPNQNVYDVGATGVVLQPEMFGTDSANDLGTKNEESPMGEDID